MQKQPSPGTCDILESIDIHPISLAVGWKAAKQRKKRHPPTGYCYLRAKIEHRPICARNKCTQISLRLRHNLWNFSGPATVSHVFPTSFPGSLILPMRDHGSEVDAFQATKNRSYLITYHPCCAAQSPRSWTRLKIRRGRRRSMTSHGHRTLPSLVAVFEI